jgi:hypothetical protein
MKPYLFFLLKERFFTPPGIQNTLWRRSQGWLIRSPSSLEILNFRCSVKIREGGPNTHYLTLQQRQCQLRRLVCLCQNSNTGLLQDIVLGHCRSFLGDVSVKDT